MTSKDRLLIATYVVIAVAALFATWSQNLAFMAQTGGLGPGDFVAACFANHAAASITLDIGFFSLAAFIFMGLEARRLKIRFVWLYWALSLAIAVSVMFPLFMAVRQARLAKLGDLTRS
jgi:hypothetical protein